MKYFILKDENERYFISLGGLFDPLIGPFASKKDAEEARAALEAEELVCRWIEEQRAAYEALAEQWQEEQERMLEKWLKDNEAIRLRILELIEHLLIKPEEPDDDDGFSPGA